MITPGAPAGPGCEDERGGLVRLAGRPLSLEDFVVLNDEIRAFVRAGIPLDVGLRSTATRCDGLLQEVADRVAERTARGESLPAAIAAEGTAVPAEYRALLTAGLRTGRLTEVLSSISELGESVSRLRRQLRLSFVYPAIVLLLAYGLFIGLVVFVVPTIARTHEMFHTDESRFVRGLMRASETVSVWGVGLPMVLAAATGALGLRRMVSAGALSAQGFGWLPGARDIVRARFAHVMSVLIQYDVPLTEAARLSGDACGSGSIRAAAHDLARRIERGDSLTDSLAATRALPAFMKWLMAVGEQQGSLSASLRQAAEVYEQRALARLDRFQRLVPPLIVLVLGGIVTLTYGLSVFIPMTELLESLQRVPR